MQLADGFKPRPFYRASDFDFHAYCRQGGSTGPGGLWLQLLMTRAAYPGTLSRIADIATALGCDQSGLIDGTGSGLVPAVAYYGLSSGLALCLAFAGTSEVSQWLSYLHSRDQAEYPSLGGKVFGALGDIGELVWPKVRDFLAGWNTDVFLILAGHSLGGAMVEIVRRKLWAERHQTKADAYTYACPRVGNREFADYSIGYLNRVVLEGDPVCDLPPPVFTRQLVSGALGRTTSVVPTQYRHGNCQRVQISTDHRPESDQTGPRYENHIPLSEINLALSLDGFSARHGTAAYERALSPWIERKMRETAWFSAAAAASDELFAATGY